MNYNEDVNQAIKEQRFGMIHISPIVLSQLLQEAPFKLALPIEAPLAYLYQDCNFQNGMFEFKVASPVLDVVQDEEVVPVLGTATIDADAMEINEEPSTENLTLDEAKELISALGVGQGELVERLNKWRDDFWKMRERFGQLQVLNRQLEESLKWAQEEKEAGNG